MATGLRQRNASPKTKAPTTEAKVDTEHPGGHIKHSGPVQVLRLLLVILYFFSSCCTIVATQFLGLPLYWINKDLYYAYMALTKQSFGIFVTTLTKWWAPTVVRISGDASVAGQLRTTADGRVECHFPDRIVMIANHQVHPSLFLHPVQTYSFVGWGMRFYGFIFMSRKMSTDQPRLAHRLQQLKEVHAGPMSGTSGLDPMWLLLFPEGTNASDNGRIKSAAWAEKQGIRDMEHMLLPRSTGSFFCLNELKGSVDWVYDCTLAYEGVPRGEFGQDLFTLRSMYLQGRAPPSVNMYWRRFAIKDMPLDNAEKFEAWLRERWYEKDSFIDHFLTTGRFPAAKEATNGVSVGKGNDEFIETEVKLKSVLEVGNIFVVLAAFALVANIGAKIWNAVLYGRQY
ncbi:related to acetyltransferase [Rhynchosporium secalis]|uniref:Related to acetyltransferase n=1 Tax=Rhynchosporium secalis TaxID=38038 RepID=A0A1E1MWB7_RHYSE|nr:related to acetyltransferase [Rhynchosporium secalis]